MSQFLEVIEWFDETGTEMVHRIPETGSAEVKFGGAVDCSREPSGGFL